MFTLSIKVLGVLSCWLPMPWVGFAICQMRMICAGLKEGADVAAAMILRSVSAASMAEQAGPFWLIKARRCAVLPSSLAMSSRHPAARSWAKQPSCPLTQAIMAGVEPLASLASMLPCLSSAAIVREV